MTSFGRPQLASKLVGRPELSGALLPEMQRGLYFLELPLVELGCAIREEVYENPFLEADEEEPALSSFDTCDFQIYTGQIYPGQHSPKQRNVQQSAATDTTQILENTIAQTLSLYDFLMVQAQETFENEEELKCAQAIIGNLDPSGLISIPLKEIAASINSTEPDLCTVLAKIQEFDPPGIAARSLQESLLLQLKRSHKGTGLAFQIVADCFNLLLNNEIALIAKRLNKKKHEIREILDSEIASLDFRPGASLPCGHYPDLVQPIIADLEISYSAEAFTVSVGYEQLPRVRLNPALLDMLQAGKLPKEQRSFLKERFSSGKWLLRHLFERERTLLRIGEKIAEKQRAFLSTPHGKLAPWTMKELAVELDVNISTIARAIHDKYLAAPRGICALRTLFTCGYATSTGEQISNTDVKKQIQKLIAKEDPVHPLSDEELARILQKMGIPCARRTVAKYRDQLHIACAHKRKR